MQNILGIARYEFLLQWRGRSLRVLALTTLLVTCAGLLIWNSLPEGELTQRLNATEGGISTNVMLTFLTFPALIVLVVFGFPVGASESLPADRHYGTLELIESLPVTVSEYLIGKLVGYWAAGGSAIAAAFVVNGVLWWLTLRSYDVLRYAEMWVVAALVLIINTGIGILIGGTQPNRIRAAALVICVFIVSTLLIGTGGSAQQPTLMGFINLARIPIITTYVNLAPNDELRIVSPPVYLSLVIGILELLLVFSGAFIWRRRSQ